MSLLPTVPHPLLFLPGDWPALPAHGQRDSVAERHGRHRLAQGACHARPGSGSAGTVWA